MPGHARLGGIGLDIDLPTAPADPEQAAVRPLAGLQRLARRRRMRVAADGADALDDAVLELVLGLVKSQTDAALAAADRRVSGLLGCSGDAVLDFPITELPVRGPIALADGARHLHAPASRADWSSTSRRSLAARVSAR